MTSPDLEPALTDQGRTGTVSVATKALGVLRRGWLGLLGQGLSFLAMLMPIAFAEFQQLSTLLVASAGAQVLSYTFTLGFPSVFPRIREAHRMRSAILASGGCASAVCLLLLAAGAGLALAGRPGPAAISLAWGGMTACQALYLMTAGAAVRYGNYPVIATGRLVYGAAMAAGTLIACLWSPTRFGLVLAASLAYVVAATFVCFANRVDLAATLTQRERDTTGSGVRAYLRDTREASVSAAFTGLASQLNLLIIPGIGVYHDAWTGLMRLAGGVTTVSMQLIAPALDIQVSQGVRDHRPRDVLRGVKGQLYAGLGLGVLTIVVALPLLSVVGALDALHGQQVVTVSVAGTLYVVAMISVSAMFNTLLLLGEDRSRLLWAVGKSALLAAVIVGGGDYRLQWCVLVEVVTDLAYIALVWRGMGKRSVSARGRHRRSRRLLGGAQQL